MGAHRATVVDNVDPLGTGRLLVLIGSREPALWAARVFPISAFATPEVRIGADVWVVFEEDRPDRPVVLGLISPPSRREALGRDREAMGDSWDQGHAAGSSDAHGGTTANPYR